MKQYKNIGPQLIRQDGTVIATGDVFTPTERELRRMTDRKQIGPRFVPVGTRARATAEAPPAVTDEEKKPEVAATPPAETPPAATTPVTPLVTADAKTPAADKGAAKDKPAAAKKASAPKPAPKGAKAGR